MGFSLVDRQGNQIDPSNSRVQMGLLLWNGTTVCDDEFNDNAARAICKEIGYESAISWGSASESDTDEWEFFPIRSNYSIGLDEVECRSTDWESCSYEFDHNCGHSEDVHLICQPAGINITFLAQRYGSRISRICAN